MNVNDCIVEALQVPSEELHINDLLRRYYRANGATGTSITDLAFSFLLAQGVSQQKVNDMWRNFFVDVMGYQPSLSNNDMKYYFWCNDKGVIP